MKINNKNADYGNWVINDQITAAEVRVIGADGTQIGVMPILEALELARKDGLDLIQIATHITPPVVKIANFGKFRYKEEKKLKEQKKKAKGGEVKEIRFSPFIAEQDYQTRLKRVKEFLDEGNKVRASVVFKGRQMDSKDFGYKVLNKTLVDLRAQSRFTIILDMEPKFNGRHLTMVISQSKKQKNAETEN